MISHRDLIEDELLKIEHIRPYSQGESRIVDAYKDGTFGVSNLAFALYSNGHSLRGKSAEHPFGLMYDDGESIFSLGYYRREHDPADSPGYLFIVAPRGKDVIQKAVGLSTRVLQNESIACKGVYARFLTLPQYREMLQAGFLPAKENPWHPEAPEEDETYTHSIVNIERLIGTNPASEGIGRIHLTSGCQHKNSRRKVRDSYNRFGNFLQRNGIAYSLEELTAERIKDAENIVHSHFAFLQRQGKAIGSTAEDHKNSLDPGVLALPDVQAYCGYLGAHPVSVFVGEKVGKDRFALYTPFTLRDARLFADAGFSDETGLTALPTYSYLQLFSRLRQQGLTEVHLGGSELPDLNVFKRQLGGRSDPSYWAVKLK